MPRIAEPSTPRHTAARSGPEPGFADVVGMIRLARAAAHQAVNTALIDLYWWVGGYISQKIESAAWGEGVVAQLATHIAREHPDLAGFTRSDLFRMRQFYDAYRDAGKVVGSRGFYLDLLFYHRGLQALVAEYAAHLPSKELLETTLARYAAVARDAGWGES